jgi:hypothetical protein
MIEMPTRVVVDYLRAFDLAAIFITSRANIPIDIVGGRNLSGCVQWAAWLDSLDAALASQLQVIGTDLRCAPRQGRFIGITVGQGAAAIEARARHIEHERVLERASGKAKALADWSRLSW